MRDLTTYRRNPLQFFDDMKENLQSFFEDFPTWSGSGPAVDVREEATRYLVEAELPGMTEKDIEVKLDGNVLSISSKKKEEKEEKREGYLRRERRSAAFHRSFSLPSDVKQDGVDAEFKNGLLTVELRKTEASKPRTIDMTSKEK